MNLHSTSSTQLNSQTQYQPQNPNTATLLPNLNSPSRDIQDINDIMIQPKDPNLISLKSKFDVLNDQDKIEEIRPPSPHNHHSSNATLSSSDVSNPNQRGPPQTSPRTHQPTI